MMKGDAPRAVDLSPVDSEYPLAWKWGPWEDKMQRFSDLDLI